MNLSGAALLATVDATPRLLPGVFLIDIRMAPMSGPRVFDEPVARRLLTAALFAALGSADAGPVNLLVNGSFEDRVVTAADTCLGSPWCVRSFASTPGWTQFADGVDLVNTTMSKVRRCWSTPRTA